MIKLYTVPSIHLNAMVPLGSSNHNFIFYGSDGNRVFNDFINNGSCVCQLGIVPDRSKSKILGACLTLQYYEGSQGCTPSNYIKLFCKKDKITGFYAAPGWRGGIYRLAAHFITDNSYSDCSVYVYFKLQPGISDEIWTMNTYTLEILYNS